jgi:hypothetical protein
LFSGYGEKENDFTRAFRTRITQRKLPEIAVRGSNLELGGLRPESRSYSFLSNSAGFRTTTYIKAYGNDLFTSWDLWYRQRINWVYILILAAVSFLLATVLGSAVIGFVGQRFGYYGGDSNLFSGGLILLITWIFFASLAAAVVAGIGNVVRGNWQEFLLTASVSSGTTFSDADVNVGAAAGCLIVGLMLALPISGTAGATVLLSWVAWYLVLWIASLIAGRIGKGDPQAYFRRSYTLFQADDALMMFEAVQNSLLQAADDVGIPKEMIHPLDVSRAGRQGRQL